MSTSILMETYIARHSIRVFLPVQSIMTMQIVVLEVTTRRRLVRQARTARPLNLFAPTLTAMASLLGITYNPLANSIQLMTTRQALSSYPPALASRSFFVLVHDQRISLPRAAPSCVIWRLKVMSKEGSIPRSRTRLPYSDRRSWLFETPSNPRTSAPNVLYHVFDAWQSCLCRSWWCFYSGFEVGRTGRDPGTSKSCIKLRVTYNALAREMICFWTESLSRLAVWCEIILLEFLLSLWYVGRLHKA